MADKPLRISLFGGIRVTYYGKSITNLRTVKNSELVAYLALYPSRDNRIDIAELFWPDALSPHSGDPAEDMGSFRDHNPRSNLNQAIFLLRNAFRDGQPSDISVFLSSRSTIRLNPDLYWCDAVECKRHLNAARRVVDRDGAIKVLQSLEDYKVADYLIGFDTDWIAAEKETLQADYAQVVESVKKRFDIESIPDKIVQLRPVPPEPSHKGEFQILYQAEHDNFFSGREDAIRTVSEWLCVSHLRLITLTGMGGIGKTRLAARVGSRLAEEFGLSGTFVSLVTVHDASLLPNEIAKALPIHKVSGTVAQLMDRIVDALSGREYFLVLDNFEHIAEEGAVFVSRLLHRLPQLSLLVASRHVLHLPGEQEFIVSPLPLPDDYESLEDVAPNPSV